MLCPMCGSRTKVVDTTQLSKGRLTRRKVQCLASEHHRFDTEEERVGWRLERDVHIRHSGDDKVQLEPFQPSRLLREVKEAVIGRITHDQIEDAVQAAISRLKQDVVPSALPLEGAEYEKLIKATGRSGPIAWIYDYQVREAVELELRKTNRIAHILYSMAFIGRPMKGKAGWRQAEDFVDWLFATDVYPDLNEIYPERLQQPFHLRWRPKPPETVPVRVIKREGRSGAISQSGGSGGTVDFLESRFLQSIRYAMLGRPNAKTHSQWVSWWVLHELVGQHTVHSSQLAVGVLNCLRRVDDIAYLRWAIQLKDFHAVRDIKAEALGLIAHPSDRIVFSETPLPRRHVEKFDSAKLAD